MYNDPYILSLETVYSGSRQKLNMNSALCHKYNSELLSGLSGMTGIVVHMSYTVLYKFRVLSSFDLKSAILE